MTKNRATARNQEEVLVEEKSSEVALPEEIINKYKILDEKCEEALKRIRRRKKSISK